MAAEQLAGMAMQLDMQPRFVGQKASDMADSVREAITQAADEIAPDLTPLARSFAELPERFVTSSTQKLAARITAAR